MALSAVGRKALLEHGTQLRVATRLDVSTAYVSAVVNGEMLPKTRLGWRSYRKVQRAVAKALGLDVTEAFQAWERGEQEEIQQQRAS